MNNTKNILIVIGHSSRKSLSHKLAKRYSMAAKEAGNNVSVIDVYSLDRAMPIQSYQDYTEWDKDKSVRIHYQNMISEADKIVFFHPIWWGSMPPLLKNFLDQTLTPGFAYKYQQHKWLPKSLNVKPKGYLNDKRVHVFMTYDGYTLGFVMIGFPFLIVWVVSIFLWCGITKMRFTLHQRVRWADDNKRTKWLQRAERLGRKA